MTVIHEAPSAGKGSSSRISLKPSLNWLLIFIPVSLALESAHAPDPVLFFSAALAIVPIARLIVLSTEQLATRTGDAVGGLLNATFGNAPELIIALVALRAGMLDMVRASIIGAILANLMLAMGVAFLLGGLRYHTQEYNSGAARLYSSMMLISAVSLGVPSAFNRFFSPDSTIHAEKLVNLGTAVVLLAAYALYLVFLLKTHPDYFASATARQDEHGHGGSQWSLGRAVGSLVGASLLAAWMSELLVGAVEEASHAFGLTEVFVGVIVVAVVGNAAEHSTAVLVARKNHMDLALNIAVGSSIQIALLVAPLLVFASYFIGPAPLDLRFTIFEVLAVGIAVFIANSVAQDGESNWLEGFQLLGVYVILGIAFYLIPA